MVSSGQAGFLPSVEAWLQAEPRVQSAVLFGSAARAADEPAASDTWSDYDLHVITRDAVQLEEVNWERGIPSQQFCMQVVRPATGGVRKVTAIFASGQIDLIIVPSVAMRFVRLAFWIGLHKRFQSVQTALDEMSTCLAGGYRFLKGEREWGRFYSRVATELAGVRLDDAMLCALADIFLCEHLWVLQKIERGEFAAAQYALHRQLAETNFRLLRELRLRRKQPLPSFGLGRRVESLLPFHELAWVNVDARPERRELSRAAGQAYDGLKRLMAELVPAWKVPAPMESLIGRYAVKTDS